MVRKKIVPVLHEEGLYGTGTVGFMKDEESIDQILGVEPIEVAKDVILYRVYDPDKHVLYNITELITRDDKGDIMPLKGQDIKPYVSEEVPSKQTYRYLNLAVVVEERDVVASTLNKLIKKLEVLYHMFPEEDLIQTTQNTGLICQSILLAFRFYRIEKAKQERID